MPNHEKRIATMSHTGPFQPGDLVLHAKGGVYRIVGPCTIEAQMMPAYAYTDISTSYMWVRRASEMEDGRFSLIESADSRPTNATGQVSATLAGRSGALGRQVGGDHYHQAGIQPWDIWEAYHLDPWEASALKYLLRRKPGVDRVTDLAKAVHYLERCIEREQERQV